MLWDVFCRVVDNFGDIGVCWRLATGLAGRGEQVRLWVDDARALAWMAPQLKWMPATTEAPARALGQPGVTVLHTADTTFAGPLPCPAEPGAHHALCGDVVVETFGCDPPDAFLHRMQARAQAGQAAQWLNLEYLSAEDYVERSHRLRSPVWSGPGAGLHKHFFYPGFTSATGGLLRDPAQFSAHESASRDGSARASLLARLGISAEARDLVVLVFCYPDAPVKALLDHLDEMGKMGARASQAVHVLLAPGAATAAGQAWDLNGTHPTVKLHALPYLPQTTFDELLWCTDLNFVRGEDSATQALWSPAPHVWHIYPQDDGVHADKLDAFMARWMGAWPPELSRHVQDLWRAWNGLALQAEAQAGTLPPLPDCRGAWRESHHQSRQALLAQADLVTQLLDFVTAAG